MSRAWFDMSGRFWVHVNKYAHEGSGFDEPQWSFDTVEEAKIKERQLMAGGGYRFAFVTEPGVDGVRRRVR